MDFHSLFFRVVENEVFVFYVDIVIVMVYLNILGFVSFLKRFKLFLITANLILMKLLDYHLFVLGCKFVTMLPLQQLMQKHTDITMGCLTDFLLQL